MAPLKIKLELSKNQATKNQVGAIKNQVGATKNLEPPKITLKPPKLSHHKSFWSHQKLATFILEPPKMKAPKFKLELLKNEACVQGTKNQVGATKNLEPLKHLKPPQIKLEPPTI